MSALIAIVLVVAGMSLGYVVGATNPHERNPMDTQKPGWQSTAGILTIIAIIVGALSSLLAQFGLGDEHVAVKIVGLLMTILGALGYGVTNAMVKKADALKTNALAEAAKALQMEAAKAPQGPPRPPQ